MKYLLLTGICKFYCIFQAFYGLCFSQFNLISEIVDLLVRIATTNIRICCFMGWNSSKEFLFVMHIHTSVAYFQVQSNIFSFSNGMHLKHFIIYGLKFAELNCNCYVYIFTAYFQSNNFKCSKQGVLSLPRGL